MIIFRQRAFSEEPEQKEFNSKAAKALNRKYLKTMAPYFDVPVYEAKGFKTVEKDPKEWVNKLRDINRKARSKFKEVDDRYPTYEDHLGNVNAIISNTSAEGSASSLRNIYRKSLPKKSLKKNLVQYDHGDMIESLKKGGLQKNKADKFTLRSAQWGTRDWMK